MTLFRSCIPGLKLDGSKGRLVDEGDVDVEVDDGGTESSLIAGKGSNRFS